MDLRILYAAPSSEELVDKVRMVRRTLAEGLHEGDQRSPGATLLCLSLMALVSEERPKELARGIPVAGMISVLENCGALHDAVYYAIASEREQMMLLISYPSTMFRGPIYCSGLRCTSLFIPGSRSTFSVTPRASLLGPPWASRFLSGELRFLSWELRFLSWELRFLSWELRSLSSELRSLSSELRLAKVCLSSTDLSAAFLLEYAMPINSSSRRNKRKGSSRSLKSSLNSTRVRWTSVTSMSG